jgi:PIN domain nuclease of toxin-antitoxin system
MNFVLDTHVLLWWLADRERLSRAQRRALLRASPDGPLLVSDISLWEVAMLHELGRIELDLPLRDWLERAVAPPLVRRHAITPAIAAEVAALPPSFPRDPADRILVATARILGSTLITSDRRILDADLVTTLT